MRDCLHYTELPEASRVTRQQQEALSFTGEWTEEQAGDLKGLNEENEFRLLKGSGHQPVRDQGPVSWKTICPQTGVGGWFPG